MNHVCTYLLCLSNDRGVMVTSFKFLIAILIAVCLVFSPPSPAPAMDFLSFLKDFGAASLSIERADTIGAAMIDQLKRIDREVSKTRPAGGRFLESASEVNDLAIRKASFSG